MSTFHKYIFFPLASPPTNVKLEDCLVHVRSEICSAFDKHFTVAGHIFEDVDGAPHASNNHHLSIMPLLLLQNVCLSVYS